MARPKESNEMKVLKVYPEAMAAHWIDPITRIADTNIRIFDYGSEKVLSSDFSVLNQDAAWQDALTKIRKGKIKAAKDKRKPIKVPKEIKKHVGLTMYPSDKAMIVKGFGSVQKFLDLSIREYKNKK